MVVELIAEVCDDPSANKGCELRFGKKHRAADRKQTDNGDRQNHEYGLVPVGEDVVENFLDEVRNRPAGRAINQHADRGQDKMRPNIGSKIFKKPEIIFHSFLK